MTQIVAEDGKTFEMGIPNFEVRTIFQSGSCIFEFRDTGTEKSSFRADASTNHSFEGESLMQSAELLLLLRGVKRKR